MLCAAELAVAQSRGNLVILPGMATGTLQLFPWQQRVADCEHVAFGLEKDGCHGHTLGFVGKIPEGNYCFTQADMALRFM